MSKELRRITEAELRDAETDNSPYMRKFGTWERRLVAEVRLLRSIIVAHDAARFAARAAESMPAKDDDLAVEARRIRMDIT